MRIGDVSLISPYATAQGFIFTTSTTAALETIPGTPSLCTIYHNYGQPSEVSTTYSISSIGSSTIALGAVVTGSDRAYSKGDFVLLRLSTASSGSGTVTSVSVATANGVSGSVATATTTPAITLTLGAITPTTIVATGAVSGSNLSGTNTGDQTIALTSDVTGTGTGSFATTIAAAAVTYAKIQDVAASSLLGNPTGGAASPSEITFAASSGLSFSGSTIVSTSITASALLDSAFGSTQGNLLYRNATVWVVLAPGSSGQLLNSGGAAANLSWSSVAAAQLPTTGLTVTQSAGAITADSDGATITFDLSASNWHKVTLGGARTLALSNPTTGQQFSIVLVQDTSAPRTVTWFSGIKWASGTVPTLTATNNAIDVFTFKCISVGVYYGFIAGQAMA